MSNEIILYDLKSQGDTGCFSPNVWKARLSLNFKGLPYRSEWLEFPEIAPLFKSYGLAPNESPELFAYSCPAIKFPDGSFSMESRNIATALEKFQPTPSLHLDSDRPERAQAVVNKILYAIGPGFMYRIPTMLLSKTGGDWYYEERKKLMGGIALDDFAGKFQWDDAEAALGEIRDMLNEHQDGPFVLGKEAGFADFVIVGLWMMCKKIDRGDIFDRIMGFDGSIRRHWDACQRWFERHDY